MPPRHLCPSLLKTHPHSPLLRTPHLITGGSPLRTEGPPSQSPYCPGDQEEGGRGGEDNPVGPSKGGPHRPSQWVGKCSKAGQRWGLPVHRAQWVGECSKGSVCRQEEGAGVWAWGVRGAPRTIKHQTEAKTQTKAQNHGRGNE
jgi:hypothetical protein